MLRYVLFGLLATIAIVGVKLTLKSDEEKTTAQTIAPANLIMPSANNNSLNTASKGNLIPGVPALNKLDLAEDSFANIDTNTNAVAGSFTTSQSAKAPAWQDDPTPPDTPLRFSNKGIDARALKISKQQISSASVGSQLTFPIPQTGQEYSMSVQEVGRHPNGDKTLKGHIKNRPDYAVIMTEGKNSTFATINTPEGSFLLEANQEQGWMLAAADLNTLIDPNLPDYQIPDINRSSSP